MTRKLDDLEWQVRRALASGDPSGIDVLGYGEISTVLRVSNDGRSYACKRLPPFPPGAIAPYRRACSTYLATLDDRGIRTAPSTIEVVPYGDDRAIYCVQPIEDHLLVDHLRTVDSDGAASIAERLVAAIDRAIDDRVGLDAQVSNWALTPDGDFVYLDVTTPLLRDETGGEMLDTDLFIASLPAFLRPGVRRFVLPEILSHYYDARAALVDLIGNLKKERLEHMTEPFLAAANRRVEPAITHKELAAYYRSDALMWEVLQRLRRTDRWWQRTVRRRGYPFLLPGKVDR